MTRDKGGRPVAVMLEPRGAGRGASWTAWSANWDRQHKTALPKYADTDPKSDNPYKPMAPLAQFDQQLLDGVIDPREYDRAGWQCAGNAPCPPLRRNKAR